MIPSEATPNHTPLPSQPAPAAPLPPAAEKRSTRGILLVIFHLLAVLGMLGFAAVVVITTLLQMTRSIHGVPRLETPLPNFLLATALAFSGVMLIPSTIQAFRIMLGSPDRPVTLPRLRVWSFIVILAMWVLVAVVAQLYGAKQGTWYFLPPLVMAGIGIPVFLLYRIGTHGLELPSRQKAWSVFGLGLAAGPLLAGAAEVAVYLLLLLGGSLLLVLKPEWRAIYTQVASQLDKASSPDQVLTVVGPYLMNPAAILLMLLVVSVIIPLIEELIKPIGIWMLRRNPPTPQQGFALGVISGAGFALLESLLAAASNNGDWGLAFLARVGGGIMHMLNTGLMGWAIASFWQERRFGRLARTYGLVVLLHGLWNGITVVTVLGSLRMMSAPGGQDLLGGILMGVSVFGLVVMAVGGLITLSVLNRRMQPAIQPPQVEPATNPPLNQN